MFCDVFPLFKRVLRGENSLPSDNVYRAMLTLKSLGIWSNMLVESLGWESRESEQIGMHAARMNPGRYAPTWSWASVDGHISYVSGRPVEGFGINQVVYDLELRKLNAASGLITVVGHLVLVELSCRIEADGLSETEAGEEKELKYKYEVQGVYADASGPQGFPMKPDVALKPWSGDVNGRHISTVIRVPFGEAIPEKSWNADCLCLLVSKSRLRCLVLFLGASLLESGVWERLGMVEGLHPGIFRNSQRQTINIG
jgi:hypothetical protein